MKNTKKYCVATYKINNLDYVKEMQVILDNEVKKIHYDLGVD